MSFKRIDLSRSAFRACSHFYQQRFRSLQRDLHITFKSKHAKHRRFEALVVYSTLVDKKLGPTKKVGLGDRQTKLPNKFWTIPTQLTLARIAMIPALIGCYYYPSQYSAICSGGIFIIAAFTDWLDGYLARVMQASSKFGAFLDPVADKLMVVSVLILLCTKPIQAGFFAGNEWILPSISIIIVCREIMMSALREWAATAGEGARQALEVSGLGKWKTATQMASLALLLFVKDGGNGFVFDLVTDVGVTTLGIACGLTIWSLTSYIKALWKFISR